MATAAVRSSCWASAAPPRPCRAGWKSPTTKGLLLAVPDGGVGADGRRGWNDCRADAHTNLGSDDVAFLDAIVAHAAAQLAADPARVYVMGMSNGGTMALRYGIEARPALASVASVGASMAEPSRCAVPAKPVAALIGTADPLVPYRGGAVGFSASGGRGGVIGVEAAVALWRRLDGLEATVPVVQALDHRDLGDPTRAVRSVWGADAAGLQVELLRIDGGGHVEPSIGQRIGRAYSRIVGPQNADLDVAAEAWHFFRDKVSDAPQR